MGLSRKKPAPEASVSRDLDETRRLAYMALAPVTDKRDRNLAGTLVNALAHHQKEVPADEAMTQVCALLESNDEGARSWMLHQVARINDKLGD